MFSLHCQAGSDSDRPHQSCTVLLRNLRYRIDASDWRPCLSYECTGLVFRIPQSTSRSFLFGAANSPIISCQLFPRPSDLKRWRNECRHKAYYCTMVQILSSRSSRHGVRHSARSNTCQSGANRASAAACNPGYLFLYYGMLRAIRDQ